MLNSESQFYLRKNSRRTEEIRKGSSRVLGFLLIN
jgi:hypothetical protein